MAKIRRKKTADSVAESGTIKKSWRGRKAVALVYPNTYHIGMSNLGFQTVYDLLNGNDGVVCERVFLPAAESWDKDQPLSVESARKLNDFDLIAFSISFENDYPNILRLLDKAKLPFIASQRSDHLPLVIAGGVTCFINPEPIAPFFDAFIIGEIEESITVFTDWISNAADPSIARKDRLLALAQTVPGAYVPEFYEPHYHDDGTLADFSPISKVPSKIKALHLSNLSDYSSCTAVLTQNTTFESTFLIEVSRGCPHGCRFCSAGYIYRPPRFRGLSQLENDLKTGKQLTCRIGLVGAAVSDLPDIEKLCTGTVAKELQIGFSSLRADALTGNLIEALKKSGIKTATIAPDAGSERLRKVINKGLKEEQILQAATKLVSYDIANLKLYFMIGLPTETKEDVDAIISLCQKIKQSFLKVSRTKGKIGEITVSLNSFIPKPFTPFQWAAMEEVKQLKGKIKQIRQALSKVANLKVNVDVPRWGFIQALFARGDRRVAGLLEMAHKNGGNWPQVLKNAPIDPNFYVHRQRDQNELLPWDFIDHGIDKSFLWQEYQRALKAKQTPACPANPQKCNICGVCR